MHFPGEGPGVFTLQVMITELNVFMGKLMERMLRRKKSMRLLSE